MKAQPTARNEPVVETGEERPRADRARTDAGGEGDPDTGAIDDAERLLVERLRAGDAELFASLVDRWHQLLLHLCSAYVSNRSVAEEIVQETWIAVISGLERFQGRSTLRSWVCSIAINRARMQRRKERRTVLVAEIDRIGADDRAPGSAADFDPEQDGGQSWDEHTPEALLSSAETSQALARAVDALPPAMRTVLVLRDIEGVSALEAAWILNVSETYQRVLLHRARTRLRRALATILEGEI